MKLKNLFKTQRDRSGTEKNGGKKKPEEKKAQEFEASTMMNNQLPREKRENKDGVSKSDLTKAKQKIFMDSLFRISQQHVKSSPRYSLNIKKASESKGGNSSVETSATGMTSKSGHREKNIAEEKISEYTNEQKTYETPKSPVEEMRAVGTKMIAALSSLENTSGDWMTKVAGVATVSCKALEHQGSAARNIPVNPSPHESQQPIREKSPAREGGQEGPKDPSLISFLPSHLWVSKTFETPKISTLEFLGNLAQCGTCSNCEQLVVPEEGSIWTKERHQTEAEIREEETMTNPSLDEWRLLDTTREEETKTNMSQRGERLLNAHSYGDDSNLADNHADEAVLSSLLSQLAVRESTRRATTGGKKMRVRDVVLVPSSSNDDFVRDRIREIEETVESVEDVSTLFSS
jgi:hypothetical protein